MRRGPEIALIAVAVLVAVVPLPRPEVERLNSGWIYPAIQPRLTWLSNMSALSLLDVVIVATVLVLVALWGSALARRRRSATHPLTDAAIHTLAIAAVLYVWFFAV